MSRALRTGPTRSEVGGRVNQMPVKRQIPPSVWYS